MEEIASLRWDQVDLQKERLILPDRQVRLTSGVLSILQKLRKAAPPEAEWVLMSPRSPAAPYERTRLSKLVRAALVQGGLDDLSCGTCAWTTTSGWAARTRCWTLSGARAPSPGMR